MSEAGILDSGVVIGLFHKADQFHKPSLRIFNELKNRTMGRLYTTDYVAVECINFLLRKVSRDAAREVAHFLFETDGIKMVFMEQEYKGKLLEMMKRYPFLTLTDCSLVFLAQSTGVDVLYSFDSGFDAVPGVTRKMAIANP